MKDEQSYHSLLQQNIDCYLETVPAEQLREWADREWQEEPGIGVDEQALKYLALVIVDALESRAHRIVLEKGCPVLIAAGDGEHMLPAAPESILARGLEMLRDICGMEGGRSSGRLALGIRNDSLELQIEKSEALHVIHLPPLT